uniref:NTR domain-containing protein n=1 Tax=Monopterus albus TaxID=43700 RepID=A0A3Q3JSW3_MONAL
MFVCMCSYSKSQQFNDINQDVNVTATGKGQATLTMVAAYYVLPQEEDSDCQKFGLTVQLLPGHLVPSVSFCLLLIFVLADKERDASMSILDIGLFTGFTVNITDLDLLSKGRARIISKYEMDTLLSEKGSLIIYLDKVSHTRPEEISFRIHQKMKVGVLQPAAVSVYEYYDQTLTVVKRFVRSHRPAKQILVSVSVTQQCATCFLSAYKVRVENYTEGLSTDTYQVRIVNVIKEGSLDVDLLGKVRTFLSHPHCREAVDMRKDKTYLIMGTFKDVYRDDQTFS